MVVSVCVESNSWFTFINSIASLIPPPSTRGGVSLLFRVMLCFEVSDCLKLDELLRFLLIVPLELRRMMRDRRAGSETTIVAVHISAVHHVSIKC